MTQTWVAEETVVFLYPNGSQISGRIAVGLPMQISDVEAHCEVSLDGIDNKSITVMGSSPLQVLLLAVSLLGMRLHDFLSNGGQVLDPEHGESFPLESFFGPLLRAAPQYPSPMKSQ